MHPLSHLFTPLSTLKPSSMSRYCHAYTHQSHTHTHTTVENFEQYTVDRSSKLVASPGSPSLYITRRKEQQVSGVHPLLPSRMHPMQTFYETENSLDYLFIIHSTPKKKTRNEQTEIIIPSHPMISLATSTELYTNIYAYKRIHLLRRRCIINFAYLIRFYQIQPSPNM